jgi:hypothetical protein
VLWVVDAARSRVRHVRVPALRPGDPPARIARRGDRMALWGYDTWLLDPRRPSAPPARLVRGAWFFLPAAREDRLWIALPDPRSPATVRALRAVREVTVSGRVTAPDVRPPGGRWPQAALRSGLLLDGRDRWLLWSPVTRRVVRRWPLAALGFVGAAHGDLLASCAGACAALRLTGARTGAQRVVRAPGGARFEIFGASFAPAGEALAVPVRSRGAVRLGIVDVGRKRVRVVAGSRAARLHADGVVERRARRVPHRRRRRARPRDRRLPARRAAGAAARGDRRAVHRDRGGVRCTGASGLEAGGASDSPPRSTRRAPCVPCVLSISFT